jgi:hypothetical protein
MRGHGVTEDDARAKATEVEALIKRYSGWAYSPRMESELRIKLYGVLRQPMKNNPMQMVAVAEDLLRMYGTVQEAS